MKEDHASSEKNGATEANPLLDRLPAFRSIDELASRLSHSPFNAERVKKQDLLSRMEYLVSGRFAFEPTAQSLRIAITLIGMLRGSLRQRNPCRAVARRHLWALLAAAEEEATELPPTNFFSTSMQVIKGITGVGKTAIIKQILALFPERVDHGPCSAAGWISATQIVILYVNLSHDGRRGGFLYGILTKIDEILGTSYNRDLSNRRGMTIPKLTIETIAILHSHYVGLLIIDEAQLQTLMESEDAEGLQQFLLYVVNTGIPLVLSGNPAAFKWLVGFGQGIRRAYQNAAEHLHPSGAVRGIDDASDWHAVFRGISRYYVLRQGIVDWNGCSAVARKRSGGIPDFGLTLWCNAQKYCLLHGKESLGPVDIEQAYASPDFDEHRALADAFHLKDGVLLSRYTDVNASFYRDLWLKDQVAGTAASGTLAALDVPVPAPDTVRPAPRASSSEAAKLKAKQSRQKTRELKRESLQKELSEDDLRRAGLLDVHLTGLEALRAKIEQEENQTTRP